jgi:Transposase DDE domain
LFGRDAFTYDIEKDLYTCPKGELLRRQGYDHRERSVRYAARPSVCNACSLKARCTKSTKGRWIRRSFEEEYLERLRTYRNTEPYRKALRKRAVWVEPLFGEAKDWHGLRRFRLRGLEKVNTEALLIASGQNLKRLLLAFGYRGPRRPAQVVALRQPAPKPYEFRGLRRHRKRHSRRQEGFFNSLISSRKSIYEILDNST